MEKTVSTVAHARRGGERRFRGLSEADLDGILRFMFVDVAAAGARQEEEADSEMIGTRTVPPGSLLASMAIYLGMVNKVRSDMHAYARIHSCVHAIRLVLLLLETPHAL